jgi:deoxyribonuclease-4
VLAAVAAEAGAPVIVETPADGQAADIAFVRSGFGGSAR